MKRILILGIHLLYIVGVCAQANVDIEVLLQQIKANNPELRTDMQRINAQKLANRTDNNLPDPTVSYSHLWGEKDSRETIGELVVTQQFDFPTLYAARNKVNRLKAAALDNSFIRLRQQILLQAQQWCIDILMLQQQRDLLTERLKQAEQLSTFYKKRLDTGDANILEANKTNLELLNARTELRNVQVALDKAWGELNTLNGGKEWTGGQPARIADYPLPPLPDRAKLHDTYLKTLPEVRLAAAESAAAYRQITIERQGWLPKLELGYRRNTESHLGFSGLVAGISLPLFNNRHKVKTAEAQWIATTLQHQIVLQKSENDLTQLCKEAAGLQASIREYHEALQAGRSLELLRQAIEGGQINVTEYFVEVSVIYQSRQNLLELENRYRKIVAQINQNML